MLSSFLDIIFDINFSGPFLQTVIIILLGFIFRRCGIVDDSGKKLLTAIIWKISVPCFAFNAFMQDFDIQSFNGSIKVFLLSIAFYIVLIFWGKLLFLKKGAQFSTLCGLFTAIGQTTLFSMPLLNSIYEHSSPQVMLYISSISIVFRIFVYIIGFYLISGERFHVSEFASSMKRIFLTPIMIGMFLGIFVFLMQNNLPALRIDRTLPHLYVTVRTLARLLSPLSMFLIGMNIGNADFTSAIKDRTAWIVAVLRNFAAPIFVLFACLAINKLGIAKIDQFSLVSLVIAFSAPVSVSLGVICTQYHNHEESASRICFISTIITLISLPLMMTLTRMMQANL